MRPHQRPSHCPPFLLSARAIAREEGVCCASPPAERCRRLALSSRLFSVSDLVWGDGDVYREEDRFIYQINAFCNQKPINTSRLQSSSEKNDEKN
jgi:hypothetical protein